MQTLLHILSIFFQPIWFINNSDFDCKKHPCQPPLRPRKMSACVRAWWDATSWPRHTDPWLTQQSPWSLQSSEQEQRLRDNLFSPHLNLLHVHIRSRNKCQHNTFYGPNSTCPKWTQNCLLARDLWEMMGHFFTLSGSQNFSPQWSIWTDRKYTGNNYHFTKNPESHHFKV